MSILSRSGCRARCTLQNANALTKSSTMKDDAEAPAMAVAASSVSNSAAEKSSKSGEDDVGDDGSSTILQLSLHPPPFSHRSRIKFPELCKTFSSAAAWCGKTNVIACATETCARDPGSRQKPTFWIPIHLVDPERPTEHAIFNVTADSPCDSIDSIEWSPPASQRALIVANSRGRVTVWTQPSIGPLNVARAFNCWTCEHAWRQDRAVITKWLTPQSPYHWTETSSATSKSFEERFLAHQTTSSAQWPNFLCACTVLCSGAVQLRWRQWPLRSSGTKWFSSSKGVLGAGPSGIYAADVIINESGSLLVAGVPIGNPSTVVVWEVTPGGLNQQLVKLDTGVHSPPSWSGIAPLPAYLLNWQEIPATQSNVELQQKEGLLLQCSPVSNLSAYVSPEASSSGGLITTLAWGSGVAAVAFDPARGGSAIVVVVVEGHYMSPNHPDGGPSMTGWRFQRWESSRQQVAIHSVFEAGAANYGAMSHPTATTWNAVVNRSFPQTKLAMAYTRGAMNNLDSADSKADHSEEYGTEPIPVVKCIAKVCFSGHGGEVAVALLGGEIHIFSGQGLVPVENFCVKVGILVASPALSASGCCLCSAWHDSESDTSLLRIVRVQPPSSAGSANVVPLERQIADRFWWSLVTELDWWDAVAYAQSAADDGLVSLGAVAAVLDADFHSLSSPTHRQHYGPALDRIKCRMLEGADAADMRALVLDMQARLLLEVLGKGIEAALVNPSTLIPDPWQAPSETLTGLGGDAMLVDPALVQQIQSYVDVVLDLASHFLTRLRRYASFCRTLATVNNNSSGSSSRTSGGTGATTTPGAVPATSTGQAQPGATSNGGAAQVQAWVQGAIAKINNTEGGSAAVAPTMSGPSALTVSTSTFPGIPAVRLIGDCYFLHRLCQLLLFCLVFRKRQLPRYIGGTQKGPAELSSVGGKPSTMSNKGPEESTNNGARPVATVKTEDGQAAKIAQVQPSKASDDPVHLRSLRLGNGNAGQGYTADEVKYLFLVLLDLCKRTSQLAHPFPKYPAGTSNPSFRLHYIDGQFSVAPEIVEASLGPHMQNLPRPRGADAAGLLMRELELHPPAEEWNKRIVSGGPWSGKLENLEDNGMDIDHAGSFDLWPRKRRFAERDAACGIETAVGLGSFTGFMGSRRDVITSSWKTVLHAVWHKCMRCGRQTASLVPPGTKSQAAAAAAAQNTRDAWWTGRWAYGCPMCGGHWVRAV